MAFEDEIGREPFQVVTIEQPRCSLRFGVGACKATPALGKLCYNTWTTCLDLNAIAYSGKIIWVFTRPEPLDTGIRLPGEAYTLFTESNEDLLTERDEIFDGSSKSLSPLFLTYSRTGEQIRTNPIPSLVSVEGSSSRINIGASRDGESPFGITGSISITMQDLEWDDHVGDYNLSSRASVQGDFWKKFVARNKFYGGMLIKVYDGYKGQALEEMRSRLYILEGISGPDAKGKVTIEGIDPLRLTDGKRSKFPRESNLKIAAAIDASTTTITVNGTLSDLTDVYGNSTNKFLRIGSEIISYTGYTGVGPYTLTGVSRGARGTTAASASIDAACQRAAVFSSMNAWEIARYLLFYCGVSTDYIDWGQWVAEAGKYLPAYQLSTTIHEPTSVVELVGELMQQCAFYIWWDEAQQKIPLKAVRPEKSTYSFDDVANIIAGSINFERDPDSLYTRVVMYYEQRDPTKGFSATNFNKSYILIDGDVEASEAANAVRSKVIYSRWIVNEAQAVEGLNRLLARYKSIPGYATLSVDAKDRGVAIGQVLTLTSNALVDSEGVSQSEVWQVISRKESTPGHVVQYVLEKFSFAASRLGLYAPDTGAPDYDAATDEDKEAMAWYSDDDGNMPDGKEPYTYQ